MTYTVLRYDVFEKLMRLLNLFKVEVGEDMINKMEEKDLRDALLNGGIRFFGAWEGETLVATCSISLIFSTYKCAACGMLDDFYVLPDYRGKGAARGLMDYALAQCKQAGVASVMVGTSAGNAAMYRALGFETPLGELLCKNFK